MERGERQNEHTVSLKFVAQMISISSYQHEIYSRLFTCLPSLETQINNSPFYPPNQQKVDYTTWVYTVLEQQCGSFASHPSRISVSVVRWQVFATFWRRLKCLTTFIIYSKYFTVSDYLKSLS